MAAVHVPGASSPLTATLLHFQEAHAPASATGDAAAAGPQQYGVWRVPGVGVVVAFRGTATLADVLVDAAIAPTPLSGAYADSDAVSLHHGFLTGARRAEVIAMVEKAAATRPLLGKAA